MQKLSKTRLLWTLATVGMLALGVKTFAEMKPQTLAVKDALESSALASRLIERSVLVDIVSTGSRLVAVGERGHFLLSDDAGYSWRQAVVPATVTLTSVHFPTPQKGWAVGHSGVILHSSDGGEHWIVQLDGRQSAELLELTYRHSRDSALKQRVDRLLSDGPDKPLLSVHFRDEKTGWAVGAYGTAFATVDGGKRWKPILERIPNDDERHLYAVHERQDGLYLAGEQGQVWRLAPGAQDFESIKLPAISTAFDVFSAPDGALMATGLGGRVFRSTDRGTHWTTLEPAGKAAFTSAVAWQGRLVIANEAGQVFSSRDGGRTFQALEVPPFPVSSLASGRDGQLVAVGPLGVKTLVSASTKND
jgi:photosystem II stability/assembly factor-like uncharacterized protein